MFTIVSPWSPQYCRGNVVQLEGKPRGDVAAAELWSSSAAAGATGEQVEAVADDPTCGAPKR